MVSWRNLSWEPRRGRQRLTGMRRSSTRILIVAVAAAIVTAGCSSQPDIYRVVASGDGMSLQMQVASCNRDYDVVVNEDSDQVHVEVTDQRRRNPFAGTDDCSDGVEVLLDQPLGDRRLIDSIHGVELPVAYWPWNQTLYSEAEYRAALKAAGRCVMALESEATVATAMSDDGYPFLDVKLPELADGQSGSDPTGPCLREHVEPLRR